MRSVTSMLRRPLHLASATVLALSAIGATVPSTTYAATITINTTTDELNSDGDCSLREAISAANADTAVDRCVAGSGADTITVPAGTYTLTLEGRDEDAGATGDLDITDAVTIAGMGSDQTIIDADRVDRAIDILFAVTATVAGVTVQHGDETSDGGGILNRGSLTLNYSTVRDNNASNGGGVANNSTVCTYDDNGDLTCEQKNPLHLTLNSSSVIRNTASSGGGIENRGGTVTINESMIANNTACCTGGGIDTMGDATMTISRSVVNGNSADFGAGVYGSGGTITVVDSLVSTNRAHTDAGGLAQTATLNVANTTISGNLAGRDGGGIAIGQGTVNLSNVTIANNTADDDIDGTGDGGGIFNTASSYPGVINAKNTIIAKNFDKSGQATDCAGTLISQGFNLIGKAQGCTISGDTTGNKLNVDPKLGPLQNNGGSTLTHALLSGSPAIDAANPAAPNGSPNACEARDQRGIGRSRDGNGNNVARCDIGAIEVGSAPAQSINGGFERDEDGNTAPDGWSVNSLATRSSSVKRSGGYSMRHRASNNRDYSVWQAVYGIKSGTTYDFSGWTNIPATSDQFTFTLELAWKDVNGTILRTDQIKRYTAATSGWNNATASFAAPANAEHVVVRQNVTSLAATIYVDDVSLKPR